MVKEEVKVYASRKQVYRAKRKALEKIQGDVYEQYAKVR